MYYEIIKYKNINRPLFITTLCNIYSSLFPIFIHLHNSLLLGLFLLLILMFCFVFLNSIFQKVVPMTPSLPAPSGTFDLLGHGNFRSEGSIKLLSSYLKIHTW